MADVLLCEDDADLGELLSEVLTGAGYQVSATKEGRKALQLMGNSRFDVLVTDVLVPQVDGLELISAFRRRFPDGRILAISGGGAVVRQDLCLDLAHRLGANEILPKPFQSGDFLRALERARA